MKKQKLTILAELGDLNMADVSERIIGKLNYSNVVTRYSGNPILFSKNVPYPSALVFNAGVTKFKGRYVMVFRNDYGDVSKFKTTYTNLGLAFSEDGVKWHVQLEPCVIIKKIDRDEVLRSPYDVRLTVIEGRCYLCFAMTGRHGIRSGIAVTDDFVNFEILSLTTPDNRNMVLFPEKLDDLYIRLERPFTMYSRGGKELFDIWLSKSPDLRYWGDSELVLTVEQVPFANAKIGPAAPPVKTKKGWLTTFHAVDIDPTRKQIVWEKNWTKRYTCGIVLLDLNNPAKVIGISKTPILVPDAPYETDGGVRNGVIFPCGMILEDSGEVKIYYGAADTVLCLATADVNDLLNLCVPL